MQSRQQPMTMTLPTSIAMMIESSIAKQTLLLHIFRGYFEMVGLINLVNSN